MTLFERLRSSWMEFAAQRWAPAKGFHLTPWDCSLQISGRPVCNLNPVGVRQSTVTRLPHYAAPPAGEAPNIKVRRATGGRDSSERCNFHLAANHNTTFFFFFNFHKEGSAERRQLSHGCEKKKLLKRSSVGLCEAIFSYRCRRYWRY